MINTHISINSTSLSPKRFRSFCRNIRNSPQKVRILTSESGQPIHKILFCVLGNIQQSILQPFLDSNQQISTKASSREGSSVDNDNTLVDINHLAPNLPKPILHSISYTNSNMTNDKQLLETCRMEIINPKYNSLNLNQNTLNLFIENKRSANDWSDDISCK
ncbi:unnamed protein product [Cunninghamella echinulata]